MKYIPIIIITTFLVFVSACSTKGDLVQLADGEKALSIETQIPSTPDAPESEAIDNDTVDEQKHTRDGYIVTKINHWTDTISITPEHAFSQIDGMQIDGNRRGNRFYIERQVKSLEQCLTLSIEHLGVESSIEIFLDAALFENTIEFQFVDMNNDATDEIIVQLNYGSSHSDKEAHILSYKDGTLRRIASFLNPSLQSETVKEYYSSYNVCKLVEIYGFIGCKPYLTTNGEYIIKTMGSIEDGLIIGNFVYENETVRELDIPPSKRKFSLDMDIANIFMEDGYSITKTHNIFPDFWEAYANLDNNGDHDDVVEQIFIQSAEGSGWIIVGRLNRETKTIMRAYWLENAQNGNSYLGDFDGDGISEILITFELPLFGIQGCLLKYLNGEIVPVSRFILGTTKPSDNSIQFILTDSVAISQKMILIDEIAIIERQLANDHVEYLRWVNQSWQMDEIK